MKNRPGFTLVEMMVATTLVVVMMMMFAQIFQVASGLVSNQKGMAELDQNVRTLTILLRGDMKQRTFVDVVPFVAGQTTTNSIVPGYNEQTGKGYDADFRRGFFSISENDPSDPTDDVLHLTITTSPVGSEDEDGNPALPYSGKATLLQFGNPTNQDTYLQQNPDQPEADDGQLQVNNTGSSRYAEVCWFLRNGNLYRRILLIRDPYNRGANEAITTTEEAYDTPANQTDTAEEFIETSYPGNSTGNSGEFWRDFDYSAYFEPDEAPSPPAPAPNTVYGLKFHSSPFALENNNPSSPTTAGGYPRSLGIPFLRFGNSLKRVTYGTFGPREFIYENNDTTMLRFIGRYTVQETADSDFNYPGSDSTAPNDPYNEITDPPNAAGPALTLNADGLVSRYADDTERRGEDIVMSNVHEFDIAVWDDGLSPPAFVDLGHSGGGYYGTPDDASTTNPPNQSTSPVDPRWGAYGNRYDTWHPYSGMPATPYAPFGPDPDLNPPLDRTLFDENGLGADEEVWLKAIRIKIRFHDVGSDQMRDLTFTFRLDRRNRS